MPSLILLLAIMASPILGWASGSLSLPSPVVLPEKVKATLDQEYPGWKLSPVTDQIQIEFKKHRLNRSPSLVSADFDHDGKRDYAIQILFSAPDQLEQQPITEQIVIFFMARGDGYEEMIVQTMGPDPTVYLWVVNDKNVLMVLGGPVGDTTYAYLNGKIQEIESSEDVEPASL